MTDGDLLLARVVADPACDAVRLVYADYLEENGRPERAEFIRVQVELAKWAPGSHPNLLRRENELWWRIPPEAFLSGLVPDTCWRLRDEPLRERQHGWVVRRGFVEEAKLAAADWLARGDAIRAAHPVTRVVLTTVPVAAVWYDGEDEQWPVGEKLAGKTFAYHRIEHFIAERLAHKPIGYRTLALLMLRWPGVEFVLPPAPASAADFAGVIGRLVTQAVAELYGAPPA
jgi:uncharacterized protein (TIGR02996 family)